MAFVYFASRQTKPSPTYPKKTHPALHKRLPHCYTLYNYDVLTASLSYAPLI